MSAENNKTTGISLADLAGALCTLRGRPQFPVSVPDFTVQARRIVISTEHGAVWVTPGLVRAADGSWRRTLCGTALDRASRAAKAVASNYPASVEDDGDGEEEPDPDMPEPLAGSFAASGSPVRGLVLGNTRGGNLVVLEPCCDVADLTLDVTPLLVHDGLAEQLPERPLCSTGIVALASWLSGVVDSVVQPGDAPLVVCDTLLFRLDSCESGATISVLALVEPEGDSDDYVSVTVVASPSQVRACAEWWQARAAAHLRHPA